MIRKNISQHYFTWMLNKIFIDERLLNDYYDLMYELNQIEFIYTLSLDENRVRDAQDLRYEFGYEEGYSESDICRELDNVSPSLLEVIVKLICRVQDNVLIDTEHGLTNQEIFMDILSSLGIDNLIGEIDDAGKYQIADMIDTLFNRTYFPNGEGGLFTVKNPKEDMRETEIWYQFMWYLDEKIGGKYL